MPYVRRLAERIIWLTILLLAVGALAACQGGSKEKKQPTAQETPERETTIGHEVKTGGQNEDVVITFACMDYQRSEFESLARDFQEATFGISIQFVSAEEAVGWQREGNTVTTAGSDIEGLAKAADTFLWLGAPEPTDWSYLLNLQPFIDDPASNLPVDDFYPGTLDQFRRQGDLYGLPAKVRPMLIFYDKNMFDQAGVAYPEIGWTWDDLLEAASQLTVREGGEVQRYGFVDSLAGHTLRVMPHQYNVSLWDDRADPPKPLFDRPEVADVLRRYTDLALTYEIMPVPEIGSNVMASNLIHAGKAAIWTDQAFGRSSHAQRTDLGLAPFPEGGTAATPFSVDGLFASAGTVHPDAVWRWLSYLSANYQPSLEDNFPARRSVTQRLSWWQQLDEETKAIYEYALAHPGPPLNRLNSPLIKAMTTVFEDQASVEEALAAAQAQALELQAGLTQAAPAAPGPVATPQPTPGEEQTVVTFAVSDWEMSRYRALDKEFNQSHPEMQVEVIPASYYPAERSAVSDCFEGMYSIRSYPDLRQYVRSLEPLIEADADFEHEDFYPQMLEPFQYEGQLWGLPYEADALMVFYNADLFAGARVSPPDLDWHIDDFLNTAESLSGADGYGFTTRGGVYEDLLFVLERMGASLWDESDVDPWPRPTFDDPTVVAALARYADASRWQPLSPATPATNTGWPYGISNAPPAGVDSGQVAMWVDEIDLRTHYAPPLSFETGVAPLPAPSSGGEAGGSMAAPATTYFGVKAYAISADAAAPQACWEWLTFLSGQPEVVELLPVRRSIFASQDWQGRINQTALSAYQAVLESYKDAPSSFFNMRWDPKWLAHTVPWLDEAFRATVAGGDAGEALAGAQRQAEAYVECLTREDVLAAMETTPTQEEWIVIMKVFNGCAKEVDPNHPGFGEW